MDLYSAVQSRYYEDRALAVSIVHPKKPMETLRSLLKQAARAWGLGKTEFWRDPRKLRAWLGQRGIPTAMRGRKSGDDGS